MGHRRSHARVANKRGTSETLLPDPQRDRKINEGGSEVYSKSRREKTDYKRKREHKEDASRNRPKERHKGKDHHRHSSKSSAKQKTKERVSGWKNHRSSDSVSSESNSSTSFTSTEGIGHHHCSHSCSDDRSREHSKKRYKADSETLGKDYRTGNYEKLHDATHEPPELDKNELQRQESTTKSRGESSLQRKDTSVGAIGSEVKGLHSASTRKHGHSATVSRTIEQKKGLGEKKEGLEVELRQKALANFMRHQDTSCKMVEHKELSNSALFFRDATNKQSVTDMVIAGQNQGAVAEVDGGWTARLSALSDAVSLDATIDEHRWPLASDTLLPIQYKISLEGSPMACHFNSGMGEGQISSDIVQPFTENNKGSENSNPVVEEDEVVYERENSEIGHLHASIDASKKGHKLTSSSTLPEGAIMVTDTQAELAGSIPRDVIQHSESINVQHELPSKSDQELKRINGTAEHHELEGLQTDDPVTKGRIVVEMDKVCAQKASTATTSVHGKSELSLEHEGKNSECVSKPELATDAQDISTAFQQKTMSVMRGGELVQVNYKVYIPKRAAELARRRLQR